MGLVRRATRATYAAEQAWARRWVGGKLERDAALRKTVLEVLATVLVAGAGGGTHGAESR